MQNAKMTRVQMYARALGVSMTELAKKAGLNVGTVSYAWWGGKASQGIIIPGSCRVDTAKAICEAFKAFSREKGIVIPDSEFTIEKLFCAEQPVPQKEEAGA